MAGSYLWKKRDLFYEIALNSVQFYLFLMSALAFSQVEMTNNQSSDKRSVAEFVYMLFNHPILYISLGGIEIDANFGDRLAAEGEALAIVL